MSTDQKTELAPGLTLTLHADFADDHHTQEIAERIRGLFNRKAHIESITSDVAYLVAHAHFRSLEYVMEAVGYGSMMRRSTCGELASAILALLPVIDIARLTYVVDTCSHERSRAEADKDAAESDLGQWMELVAKLQAKRPESFERLTEVARLAGTGEIAVDDVVAAFDAELRRITVGGSKPKAAQVTAAKVTRRRKPTSKAQRKPARGGAS